MLVPLDGSFRSVVPQFLAFNIHGVSPNEQTNTKLEEFIQQLVKAVKSAW